MPTNKGVVNASFKALGVVVLASEQGLEERCSIWMDVGQRLSLFPNFLVWLDTIARSECWGFEYFLYLSSSRSFFLRWHHAFFLILFFCSLVVICDDPVATRFACVTHLAE